MTWTELERLPEDGPRIELYDGEVWEMPSPTVGHQDVALSTAVVLRDYARRVGGRALISPMDIVFSERDVVQPDVMLFVPERAHLVESGKRPRHRPDIVVEILSPTTQSNDKGRKLRMFARYEVPEYWIVDIDERAIAIRSLRGNFYAVTVKASGDDEVKSPLLPDLSFPVSRLFEDIQL